MKCDRHCVYLLLQVISLVANCLAENLILNINFKKPIAVTDHAFLSFTLDPTTLQYNDFTKNFERSTNLARGLAPAYVRLGGPQSNFLNFEQAYSHKIDMNPNDMYFGTQWTLLHQWAKNAGLDVIICISPRYIDNELKTDSKNPRNIAELLSFSDHMGYNISWQLGYECQTRCDLSGGELGRYVSNLREILKTFPRYSHSLITGPDIVVHRTAQQQKYIQDYLHSANSALSAITWHPDLDSVSLNNDNISIHDNIITDKDEIYKIINHAAENKPLWIAESKPEESKHQYLGALIWTRRLGNAAKLGIQVVMRQLLDLSHATPTYWVSLLYKTLVGREVLEMTLQPENESHVYFYSQCTKSSALYSKGAVTIFGINLTSRKIIANLKSLKIKILHKYILSPDFEANNKMFSEKVLLNNKSLHLINDKELPDINPEIIINPNGLELELPSDSIGFWVIPNAKVKVCICSEEETIENNLVKKLSKRHESDVRQDNQEKKEETLNQSNVIDNDVKESINQSTLKNQKLYENQNIKKQKNVENIKTESQQRVWNSKLLVKIKRILQKQLQRKNRSEPKRSFIIDLGEEEQEDSFEEVGVQQNLDKKDLKKTEDNKFENIRDILKKYKCILLQEKIEMETEGIQDLKPEIQNIAKVVALISKLDDLFSKVTSNETIMNEIKNKIKNEGESIIKINKKLKEYLIELENSVETKSNIIKKIEKYFSKLYNLLENNDPVKDNKNNQVFIHEDLVKAKRFKRHLDRKLENSEKIRILKKRSQIDNLKDYMIKQKINWKNNDKKELFPSNNLKKKLNNNKKKYNNLLQQDSMKRFFKNNAFENVAHHIDYQNLVQKHKQIENDNIYRKYSKIGDIKKYQGLQLVQEPERTKREINKKLVELGLKKDSVSKKHLRIDELKNYLNEKKTKQKDDIKREGWLVPFNPRIANSDENNFYGFFRREPVKGFPKGDIFVTTGDSLEQKNNDYDYVDDEDDDKNDAERKNTQYNQKLMLDHKDNTWVKEVEDDHCNNMPNEFFENFKLSNTKIKENPKNYEDLWEAEFPSVEHNNNKNNNNNKISIAEIIQEQPLNEKKEKRVRETSMQHAQIVNYYDDTKKQEDDRDALRLASKYSSMPFDQLFKTPASNINYQASNVELREAKLKLEPETEILNSFYLPSQVSTARYNYDNYQTSNINHDKVKLKDEKDFSMNIGNRNDINAKTAQYSTSTSVYAEHPIHDKSYHNERNKRSNWEKLQNVFAEEMIKEDEGNARDCHCRVIRASDSLKKLDYHRNKRDISVPAQFTDTFFENKNVSTDDAQSKENNQISITGEEYEEIMAGEILPSIIEIVSEETDTTTETVITDSSTLIHKVGATTQAIDLTSISGMNNISEQYNDMKKSDTNEPENSASEISLNNNNSVESITKETFFRGQSDESENETKTYDSSQVIYKIPSENKGNREELFVTVTKNPQETYEKTTDLIKEKEKTDSSIYSTITEDQKNKEGYNTDYKIGLESTNFSQEISKELTEQVSTESILLKQETSTAIDNAKSNESETNTKLLQNTEDNQNNKSKPWTAKDANARKLKIILKNLPRASLEELTRQEEHLMRRSEQINKRREKLHLRRQKLLHQYQNELTKITNEQKRNLQRRETWEKLHENDDFHRLINRKAIIGVLLNDDVIFEDDDENYLIPIELVPEQDKNIIDQIYLLVKAKKVKRYPEHNKYYEFLRNLIEDDEELVDTSNSSEHKYNQYYDYILKIIGDKRKAEGSKFLDREHSQDHQNSFKTIEDESTERESTETISKSFDHKVLIIDPSTYYGNEPILSNENLKLPKYHSNIKFQIKDPISKWILKNSDQVLSRFKSSEDQHQTSKSQEYVKKLSIKDYYDQGNANILYVLDTPKQYDLQKELDALAQVWLSSLNRRDVNRAMNDKETDELNNIYKNLKEDKDNLDLMFAVNKKPGDFDSEENIKNKEFVSSNNKKEDTINSETTEDAEKVTKTKKSETLELTKQEEINKSFYNFNSNDKAKNNLNIKISNNNKDKRIEKIIDDLKAIELEKENIRVRRNADKLSERLPHFRVIKIEDMRNKFINHNRILLKKEFFKKIINDQPIFLLTKNNIPLSAGLFQKSKNHLVSSKKDFIDDQENEKEESNYIILIPIDIKNIYDMLDAKDNDDSSERFDISAQSDDQSVFKKISDLMARDDETSEESEYKDLSNLQSESIENIPDDESLYEDEEDVSVEDSEAESEDEPYEITSNESNKYLKIRNQVGSNERGMFLLLPWRNVKKRQRRHIRNEISKDTVGIKREVTRHSQSNSILAEDFKNKHTKNYFENNIDQEEKENIIETSDEEVNYLRSQTNRKNHDDLLEDFIKARKKNNLYHNDVSSLRNTERNEIIPLNNISKNNKKLLQEKAISKLQNHKESVEELIDDSEKNFNDTLVLDEDKHYRNSTCGTTGNVFYTAIMNIKDFFAFFSKISHKFMNKF